MSTTSSSRRDFLRKMAATTALSTIGTRVLGRNVYEIHRSEEPRRPVSANDKIRIGTIGTGIIGFIDTDTALKVEGVELVAATDIYEARRVRVKEVYGDHVDTYVDYREMLARDDIDAVLICTPDHWHKQMSVDAMKAGKAVYCEKPMVWTVSEGEEVIRTAEETGAVFQVGSQFASSIVYQKAKELIAAGAIGQVNAVEASELRNTSLGAWQYSIPRDASPETLDWDRFLGTAPKRPFEPIRAFRWRNYWDYGTAMAGDLYVHLFTGIHMVLESNGPTSIMAAGGLTYWNDGRDVPDVLMGVFNYPETDTHSRFTLSLQTNLAHGGAGRGMFRFVGSEGQIEVGRGLTLSRAGIVDAHEHRPEQVLYGYNAVRTWSEAQQKAFAEWYLANRPEPTPPPASDFETEFMPPQEYDDRLDHLNNFFASMRDGAPVYEDAVFGHRAAAPSLLCNDSYRDQKVYKWDPEGMKVVD